MFQIKLDRTGYIPVHSQENSNMMSADEALVVLKKGPDNWFSWCKVVEDGSIELYANHNIQEELINLLNRISLARDKAFSDPLSRFPGKSKQKWTGECEDECYECLGSLEKKVISFHDERALKSLVALGSTYALDFGEKACPLIINRYNNTHWLGRGEMLGMMGELFERGICTESMRKEAKGIVFNAATKDDDISLRDTAIHQLHYFGREDALRKLKEISETDTYSRVGKRSKKTLYPVRDEAKSELERLIKADIKLKQ